jgi:glycosyltransferase involved in cell wall biosynthesis
LRVLGRVLPKLDPLCVMRWARWMRQDRIDLVHTHLFGDSLHGHLAAAAAGGIPVVTTLQIGSAGVSRLQAIGYRWLIPRCARVVACSDSVRVSFVEAGIARAGDLVTIRNGGESLLASRLEAAALRASLGIARDQTLLLCPGRLDPQKGHEILLHAVARLAADSARAPVLLLAGEGSLRETLVCQARREGVADRVRFLGFRSDVQHLLAAADVVVFASLHEGLSLGLLEAMAASRCIVATRVPGIAEAVRNGEEALLVPARDAAALAAALARASADAGLRAKLGMAARTRYLAEFGAERMVAAYEALYREVLGAEGADPGARPSRRAKASR